MMDAEVRSHTAAQTIETLLATCLGLNMTPALLAGVYPCCGRPAQQGTSQRPSPQSGCAYRPHSPLTPPEAPTYNLNPDSALCRTRLADTEAADLAVRKPSLAQVLLKHQDLIVGPSGEVRREEADAARVQQAEEDGVQASCERQVTCRNLSCSFALTSPPNAVLD